MENEPYANYRPKTKPKISPFWVANLDGSSIWKECSFSAKSLSSRLHISLSSHIVGATWRGRLPEMPIASELAQIEMVRGEARSGKLAGRYRSARYGFVIALTASDCAICATSSDA